MKNRKWSDDEIDKLKHWYPNTPYSVKRIGTMLGRSVYSVYGKAQALKLRRAPIRLRRRGHDCKKLNDYV